VRIVLIGRKADAVAQPTFSAEAITAEGVVIIMASGEIDLAAADDFHAAIVPHIGPNRKIVLEFSGVEFLDSSGIRVLVVNREAARRINGTLVVHNPTAQVRRVLEVVSLKDVLIEEP
jgi:anti-sigma B factor antagonist